jgi:Tfp pilus assembly protein PilV
MEATMKRITLITSLAAILTLSGLVLAQSSPGAYGQKAGLWELKMIKQVRDGQDMSAQLNSMQDKMKQMMASMTPEQRSKMESMMGGSGAMGGNGAFRMCVSPAMAARNHPVLDKDGQCQPAKLTRNGNQMSFEVNCTRNGHTTVGTGTSTIDGDVIHSEMNMTSTDAHGSHTMQMVSQMTYIGADCQGIKPLDELMPAATQPAAH